MEYRKRSLWNRVWENDSLDSLSEENYVRDVYEEGGKLPWRAVCHGMALSLWKGIQWLFTPPYYQINNGVFKEKIENREEGNK